MSSLCCCCSVTKLCLTLRPCGLQHTNLLCSSLSPRVCSNSCPLSWYYTVTSSSTTLFFSCCCLVASVMSDSVRPHRRQPTRLPHSWDSPGKNTGVGCHFLFQCMKVKSESESLSRFRLPVTPWTAAHQAPPPMGFARYFANTKIMLVFC